MRMLLRCRKFCFANVKMKILCYYWNGWNGKVNKKIPGRTLEKNWQVFIKIFPLNSELTTIITSVRFCSQIQDIIPGRIFLRRKEFWLKLNSRAMEEKLIRQ